jgi:hypothetical protein
MRRVIADAKLVADEAGDPASRPNGTTKAEGFSALLQRLSQLGEVGWAQQGRGTRGWVSPQRLFPFKRGACEPLADGTLRHAHGFGDAGLGPSHLVQFPGTETATFVPTHGLAAIDCTHRPEHSTSWPTIIRSLCSYQ